MEGSRHATPPNMLLWHTDYFELKLFKKQLVQEGHSGLRCPPENGT